MRTLLVLTSDSHANPQSYFDQVVSSVTARGGRISLYLAGGSAPDAATAAAWRAAGHEVGMHPSGFPNPLTPGYQTTWNYFDGAGFGPPSRTVRNHLVEWQGWVDAAQVAAGFNIGLETSFYTWGPAVTYPDGHQAHGYITGSGLPMRFVNQSGTIIPVYQQVTSLVDEQLVVGTYSEHLPPAAAIAVSRQLIDESQAGGYSAIMTQFPASRCGRPSGGSISTKRAPPRRWARLPGRQARGSCLSRLTSRHRPTRRALRFPAGMPDSG
jgi:hypothetical protein